MKIGHEAAALYLMTSAITTRCCFWKAKADIDLLPSAISNIQLLLSRLVAGISQKSRILQNVLSEHSMNSGIRP